MIFLLDKLNLRHSKQIEQLHYVIILYDFWS